MFWNLVHQFFSVYTDSQIFTTSFYYLYKFAPIWLPFILFLIFFDIWLIYVRSEAIQKTGSILLEIKLPKEITKSPAAMEVFLTSLYQSGAANYYEVLVEGATRPWFSLELVSIEGQVHFYIWSRPKFKNLIEAQIYAQYPSVEIYEVPDYTSSVIHNPDKNFMWGTYFKLTKPDAYPIKTYVDYGMDKDPKEEFKIDPMTSVLEYLGSMKKGEQVWIQILIMCHRKNNFMNDAVFFEKPDWKEGIQKEIDKIKEEAKTEVGKGEYAMEVTHLTKGQMENISSLERSRGKFPFETMIRGFYIATDKEYFNSIGITGLIGSVRQYSSQEMNGFKLGWFTDHSDEMKSVIGFLPFPPFVRYMQKERWRLERQMLEAYKRRSFFFPPYKNYKMAGPFILTTEELATIFHLPGQVASTPTIEKTMSKKGEAPPNLPI
ncbi:MAG: hypothetical protein WCT19_00400 [Candidatus Paceibacterota bacterium]|jgi:hypothetical protein